MDIVGDASLRRARYDWEEGQKARLEAKAEEEYQRQKEEGIIKKGEV